jgi:hypothetical protein
LRQSDSTLTLVETQSSSFDYVRALEEKENEKRVLSMKLESLKRMILNGTSRWSLAFVDEEGDQTIKSKEEFSSTFHLTKDRVQRRKTWVSGYKSLIVMNNTCIFYISLCFTLL